MFLIGRLRVKDGDWAQLEEVFTLRSSSIEKLPYEYEERIHDFPDTFRAWLKVKILLF